MSAILKLSSHNPKKEEEFELKYLSSLSVKERFEMMFKKTEEMRNLLKRHRYRSRGTRKNLPVS